MDGRGLAVFINSRADGARRDLSPDVAHNPRAERGSIDRRGPDLPWLSGVSLCLGWAFACGHVESLPRAAARVPNHMRVGQA
jgi:hypothetical protein